jgi:ribonuclease BN (tRNA processing enzyme)
MNRTCPFTIIGPLGIEDIIRQSMKLAYPTLLSRLPYQMIFHEITPEKPLHTKDASWRVAYGEHSQACLSLRLELNGKSVFYSGDGRPTPATLALASRCDMIIHEAYGLEDSVPGHGSISACVDFARRADVSRLALVHVQRDIRLKCKDALKKLQGKIREMEILLPDSGTSIIL